MNTFPGRIAVIGAGLAGLTAAAEVGARGHRVRLFDKGRGPGGRATSRHAGRFDFDHGAQYFTCRDPRFQDAVRRWRSEGVAAPWRGRVVTLGSMGHSGRQGAQDETERFVGVPSMSAVARHLARDLDVVGGTRVASLERVGSAWRLADEGGRDLGSWDQVVLSVPPAQSADLLGSVPELRERAASVRMRACWAVLLGFDTPVPAPFDGAFVPDPPLSWVARNSSKPGRPPGESWVLHAGPDWSDRNAEATPRDVAARLVQAFARAVGTTLPRVVHEEAHLWRYALADPALDERVLSGACSTLHLCGDWCAGSRVEGAFLSGLAAADAVCAALDGGAATAHGGIPDPNEHDAGHDCRTGLDRIRCSR